MKKKTLTIFMALLLFVVSCFPAAPAAAAAGTKVKEGNSENNLVNGGKAVKSGNWIYFSNRGTIYKIYKDGTKKTKIYERKNVTGFYNLNVYDGYLYCILDDYGGTDACSCQMMKITLDGKKVKRLGKAHSLYVRNGWIYYLNVKTQAENNMIFDQVTGIYKMKTDGTKKTCLVKDSNIRQCITDGRYIFYNQNTSTGKSSNLVRYDMNKKSRKVLVKNKWIGSSLCGLVQNYIYYIDMQFSEKGTKTLLYKIKNDGTGKKTLLTVPNDLVVNISGGYIYYSQGTGTSASLYKMDLEGKHKKKIFTEKDANLITDIYITGNAFIYHIFFNSLEGFNQIIYFRNSDGTGTKKLGTYFTS